MMDYVLRSQYHYGMFGDFYRGYRILNRKGISIPRLSKLYAEAGLVGFKIHASAGRYPILTIE